MMWLLVLVASISSFVSGLRFIDLSHQLAPGLPQWPGQRKFEVAPSSPPGAEWSDRSFCLDEHTGTHVDAPFHFNKSSLKVHEIPLERLIGKSVLVDIEERAKTNPNAMVLPKDLEDWEAKYGEIPAESIVIMRSGWGSRWNDSTAYLGDVNDAANLAFPGFSKEAAEFLVRRGVSGAGVDTASMDPGNSTRFDTHHVLAGNNLFGIENLANLEELPVKGATIYIMPLLIKDGTGAPARVFATVED